jgi:hypothetical protein
MKQNIPSLNYEELVEKALLGVLKNALRYVEKYGLPGNHHFYITFSTKARGVKIPEFLYKKHPESMTIVLQYEFSNLRVTDKEFGVTLSFNNNNYYIRIPFSAVTAFSDPSVQFSLQFNAGTNLEDWDEEDDQPELFEDDEDKIISLDEFRKKDE